MADQNSKPNDGTPNEDAGSQMGTDMTFPPIGEPEVTEAPQETEADARLRALEERYEQDRQAFNEERNRWQATLDRLIQTQAAPRQPEPQQPAQPQGIDFKNLPDPVDRPEEFKQALAQQFDTAINQRLSSTFDQFQQQTSQQRSVEQQLNDMWSKFQTDYPDLAAKTATLQGAAMAERQALQQRGIDPQQGILADPDGFMRRVSERMRGELGMPGPSDTPVTTPPGSYQQQQPQQQQPPANRTAGVGGGTNHSGSGQQAAKKPPSFTEQLKKMQLDNGLI